MTKPVKRYGFAMTEREYGAYVSVTDYDALLAERDELRAALDTLDRLASARLAENEDLGLRVHEMEQALRKIVGQVDGNIRETVRDCVNGQPDVQDIYEYCDRIEALALAALSQQAKPDTRS